MLVLWKVERTGKGARNWYSGGWGSLKRRFREGGKF